MPESELSSSLWPAIIGDTGIGWMASAGQLVFFAGFVQGVVLLAILELCFRTAEWRSSADQTEIAISIAVLAVFLGARISSV